MIIQHIYFDGTFLRNRAGIGRDARVLLAASREIYGEGLEVIYPKSRLTRRISYFDSREIGFELLQKILKLRTGLTQKPDYLKLPFGSTYIQPQVTNIIPLPRNGINHIIRMHDIFPITHPQWFRIFSARQFQASFKSLDPSKTSFLFDSEYTRGEVVKFFPFARSLVAYCPVRINVSEPCHDCQGCRLLQNEKRSKYVLALGTIEPRKNYDLIIKSWIDTNYSYPENALLLVIGKYGWKSRKTRRNLRKYKICGITWLNSTCDFSLNEFFDQTVLLVSASHEEGFNLPVAEATIRNIPTLISHNFVHDEIYSGTSLFFNKSHVSDLSKKLFDFLSTNSLPQHDSPFQKTNFDFEDNFSKLKNSINLMKN